MTAVVSQKEKYASRGKGRVVIYLFFFGFFFLNFEIFFEKNGFDLI